MTNIRARDLKREFMATPWTKRHALIVDYKAIIGKSVEDIAVEVVPEVEAQA